MFDQSNSAHRLELWNEITLDPQGYSYSQANIDTGIVAVINLARPEITMQRPVVSSAEIRAATTYAAYDTLSIDEQEWIRWMTPGTDVEVLDVKHTADLRLQLTGDGDSNNSMWSAAQKIAMSAAMLAVLDREGSRAEQLWGIDTYITSANWIAARDNH